MKGFRQAKKATPARGELRGHYGAASVVSPATSGIVQYAWSGSDTATAGMYSAEFEITFGDGKIETFPNSDYIRVEILDDIA